MSNGINRIKRMVIVALRQIQDPYYHGFAAQISFYLILSIVPIILLMTQLLGLLGINMSAAMEIMEQYTGNNISGVMKTLFQFNSIGAGNIIFFVIAFWAGSRASFCISRITNYTLTEGESTGKNYFLERGRAIILMAITLITLVITIIVLGYGKIITIGVLHVFHVENYDGYIDSAWMWLRWPLGFVMYLFMVSINYYILPTERRRYRDILPGSIFAALGMLIVTSFYSFYTSSLVHYDLLYGTLSSVVAILMWFLMLSWVIILGVLVNKVMDDTREPFSKRNQPEHATDARYRKSKYDMDPKHVGIFTIKDIITGADIDEIVAAKSKAAEEEKAEEEKK